LGNTSCMPRVHCPPPKKRCRLSIEQHIWGGGMVGSNPPQRLVSPRKGLQHFSSKETSFFHQGRSSDGIGALMSAAGRRLSCFCHGPILYSSSVYSRPRFGLSGQAGTRPLMQRIRQVLQRLQRTISFSRPVISLLGYSGSIKSWRPKA